jgi:hypothetical protein
LHYDAKMKKVSSRKAVPRLVVRREILRELANVELTRVAGGNADPNVADSGEINCPGIKVVI